MRPRPEELAEKPDDETRRRAAGVRAVLLDVDGVMTDGAIRIASDGTEFRSFHVRDGFGIRLGQKAGLEFAIVSGRGSEVVARRAAELHITEVHQKIWDKRTRSLEILERLGHAPAAACFVGDDLIDVPAMLCCGLAAAPADAAPEVRAAAHFVARRRGGRGAVREVVELILQASGRWEDVTAPFLRVS